MKDLDYRQYIAIFNEADEAFREDVSYAVAVAKAARTIAAKRKMWNKRREELGLTPKDT